MAEKTEKQFTNPFGCDKTAANHRLFCPENNNVMDAKTTKRSWKTTGNNGRPMRKIVKLRKYKELVDDPFNLKA